jgi:signal transduction histidine kinase
VTISAERAAGRPLVEVAVADTGSGIAPELVDHLFDRFAKSADSRGSGLGLAIARHLVEAHGGTIQAASRPGSGTTIRFSLPIDA